MEYQYKTSKELKSLIRDNRLCEKLGCGKVWLESAGSKPVMINLLESYNFLNNQFNEYKVSSKIVEDFTNNVSGQSVSGPVPSQIIDGKIEQDKPTIKEAPKTTPTSAEDTLAQLKDLLGANSSNIDIAQVKALIKEALKDHVKTINITQLDKKDTKIANSHFLFEDILAHVSMANNSYLWGGAGGGKSFIARQIAKALNLEYYDQAICEETPVTAFFGHIIGSRFSTTAFCKAYEFGGLMLVDEFDAGNGNTCTAINNAIDGEGATFPHKYIKKHKDFRCIATGNTLMLGGDNIYSDRNALGGATRDRFTFIEFKYDKRLEKHIASQYATTPELESSIENFVEDVYTIRKNAKKLGFDIIISPRASIFGAKMLAHGRFNRKQIFESAIFKGIDKESITKLSEGVVI